MPNDQVDLLRIAHVLNRHGVDCVIVGGMAVVLHGGNATTMDVDVAFDRSPENLVRLADALRDLCAKPKGWIASSFRLEDTDLATKWLHLESEAGDITRLSRYLIYGVRLVLAFRKGWPSVLRTQRRPDSAYDSHGGKTGL
ncbi:MAG: nucleotidyltransferase [Fimbriimonas sp.]|nr:nucleotidyltransferase [Fimbriimonas sp.]